MLTKWCRIKHTAVSELARQPLIANSNVHSETKPVNF
jgi:hypothetical protein